eukprot:CAMPEP_0172678368 /NCGR_PEP_ID=MMETSP1074-20121228/15345_1 /TAXON_ID=2916 /ORGANISM="Ceratium fusus, Strain PA161109" /LENGTH=190 /DNA_ID=CAMNT_0013496389 /DNA_START=222 /DNA_END=795 /DNA_ORIENTATION=+
MVAIHTLNAAATEPVGVNKPLHWWRRPRLEGQIDAAVAPPFLHNVKAEHWGCVDQAVAVAILDLQAPHELGDRKAHFADALEIHETDATYKLYLVEQDTKTLISSFRVATTVIVSLKHQRLASGDQSPCSVSFVRSPTVTPTDGHWFSNTPGPPDWLIVTPWTTTPSLKDRLEFASRVRQGIDEQEERHA